VEEHDRRGLVGGFFGRSADVDEREFLHRRGSGEWYVGFAAGYESCFVTVVHVVNVTGIRFSNRPYINIIQIIVMGLVPLRLHVMSHTPSQDPARYLDPASMHSLGYAFVAAALLVLGAIALTLAALYPITAAGVIAFAGASWYAVRRSVVSTGRGDVLVGRAKSACPSSVSAWNYSDFPRFLRRPGVTPTT